MEALKKKRRGAPVKHDFSGLKLGDSLKLTGRGIRKNPHAYLGYWNKNNKPKRLELVFDVDGNPFAKRIK